MLRRLDDRVGGRSGHGGHCRHRCLAKRSAAECGTGASLIRRDDRPQVRRTVSPASAGIGDVPDNPTSLHAPPTARTAFAILDIS